MVYIGLDVLSLIFQQKPYEGLIKESDFPYAGFACTDDPGSITQEAAVGLASSFVERLCARYANRPRKLEQMHALLAAMPFDEPLAALTPQSCTRMPSGALGLCRSFGPLLSDEPDLLREFMQYVPPSCTATQHIHPVPLPER